ncbi:MAG: hypothetical protein J6Q22_10085 [Prevotella sp.]|nr:hypothetical protein [Prevotella sp.]
MKKFYFTFPVNHPLCYYVQRIDATDESSARKGMLNYYGEHWAFVYPEGKNSAYETGEGPIVRIGKKLARERIEAIIYVDPYSDDIYCE